MAKANSSGTSKPKRGLLSFLPLIAVLIVVPVGGWFGLDYYKKKASPKKEPSSKEPAPSEEKTHGEEKGISHSLKIPSRLPLPVVGPMIVFVEGNARKGIPPQMAVTNHPLVYLRGDPKNNVPPRIVTSNAFRANILKPEKIIITFADTKKPRYAVTQLYLVGDDTEGLLRAVNDHQLVLFESITNMLSSKFYKDTRIPGFRNILRTEVLALSNRTFGSNLVQDVIIPEFITQ